ncbi:restriction endonuclease subunit S [Methylobacter psychrophilus]|uniref:restriction endonuclease subunit S n=1 Tax=Methylobacter psychrophilus TaxID=96941 RepID=UPI0021D509D1|nr:restriction endonuclease subunit S [Methylobacter psychrophilus]
MNAIQTLITEHIDIWTAADTAKKSGRGRSSGNAASVYGIKKLRELILELAVRGKLVPQDANDEPASELLKRIVAEKAKLVAEGKIKKSKPLAEITDDEKPFELPMGWELVKLGILCYKLTDGSHNPPKDAGTGFPMLSSQNVNFGKIDFNSPSRYVNADDFDVENSRTKIESGDVLLTIVASLGRPAVVPNNAPKFVLQRSVAVIKTDLMSEFLCLHLGSPLCVRYYDIHAKGTAQKGIYLGQLSEMPIVVPPIKEQLRIVAKVDELMALCDQLENQHNNAAVAHEKLVTHLLGTLTQSQNAEDFNSNWQRISEHFDTLFTTEASIDVLKQTLLQLAVMGKLVPQDPHDEPASELLKRIQAEKAKLIAEGKIKKAKPLPPISNEEKPFDLPREWTFVRKAEIFAFLNGYAFKSEWFESSGIRLLRNVNVSHGVANWIDVAYISIENAANFNDYTLNIDDLVLSLDRPIITTGLKFAVISKSDIPCLLLQRVAKISSFSKAVDSEYLAIWLNSSFFVGNIDPGRSNGVPHISTTQVANMIFALPPTAEQHRIVTKVDELMAICDQLKSRLTEANQLQQKLADVLVKQAVN